MYVPVKQSTANNGTCLEMLQRPWQMLACPLLHWINQLHIYMVKVRIH